MNSNQFYNKISWSPELVARFWDYWSMQKDQVYFGKMFGPTVVSIAAKEGWLQAPIVDVGCGPGHVLETLAGKGLKCSGVDWSQDSIDAAQARCSKYESFDSVTHAIGHRIDLPDSNASTIFMMEVLEHLLEDQVEPTLAEVRRLLRPGGHLIVSVPSNEDLSKSEVGCPNCGSVFHSVQHVRSLNESSISKMMEKSGFRVVHVKSYNFGVMSAPLLSRVLRWGRLKVRGRQGQTPHLLCVVEKV